MRVDTKHQNKGSKRRYEYKFNRLWLFHYPVYICWVFTSRIGELIANKCLPGDWSDLYKYISAGGYASSDEVHLIYFICLCFLTYIHEWVCRKGAYHEYVPLCTLYPV
jgi:hypothetical protein